MYIVKAGDNLYSIANKYNITVNELKKANNLENNNLSIGQELIIPDYSNNDPIEKPANEITYIVQKGDSLWSIAKKYDVNVNDLKSYNNLSSNLLNIGQTLLIPKTSDYQTYIVVSGDSLYKIANKFNTTIDKLKSILIQLYEIDRNIKTGTLEPALALELLVGRIQNEIEQSIAGGHDAGAGDALLGCVLLSGESVPGGAAAHEPERLPVLAGISGVGSLVLEEIV